MTSMIDYIKEKYNNDFITVESNTCLQSKLDLLLGFQPHLGIKCNANDIHQIDLVDVLTNFKGFNKITIGDIDFEPEYFDEHPLPIFLLGYASKNYDYNSEHSFDVYSLNPKLRRNLMKEINYYKFDDDHYIENGMIYKNDKKNDDHKSDNDNDDKVIVVNI